ncbi:MAG: hypothetical protein J0J10_25280, partial [Bosea sp.]|uniref:hypothetical protein n=1 Tax=Bosea sp. (in: a-proteobacteria) TaxID=1871050 RepID=UPI001AC793FC
GARQPMAGDALMTWQGFTAGFIAALVMMLMVRAALWVATSRKISDAMEAENGDWPHMGGR